MPHPHLMFCPYLDLTGPIEFAGWRVGPLSAFEAAWGDPVFKDRAEAFLKKFTDAHGKRVENPALVGRTIGPLDGQLPTAHEVDALGAALHFSFLDRNLAYKEGVNDQGWRIVTTDNTDLFIWPIDLETGHVTVTTGGLMRTLSGGFQIDDEELEIRSPLELHMPGAPAAEPDVLAAVYDVCLNSHQTPGANQTTDRIRTAIHWLAKSWKNTTSIDLGDRVVFIKTGFEALTGTSNSRESAKRLRALFESLPDTDDADAETLLWSPTEQPKHARTYKDRTTKQMVTEHLTDLEHWFMALAAARNTIIHDGVVPSLTYTQAGSRYKGPLFHTGEFVLRAAVKASLAGVGHPDLWRTSTYRAVKAAWDETQARTDAES